MLRHRTIPGATVRNRNRPSLAADIVTAFEDRKAFVRSFRCPAHFQKSCLTENRSLRAAPASIAAIRSSAIRRACPSEILSR